MAESVEKVPCTSKIQQIDASGMTVKLTSGSVDQRAFRKALGMFPTGVTVVTACDANGQALGLTISSFNSVSIDPPLILWSLSLASPTLSAFQTAGYYAVNVLAEDQVELSQRFAMTNNIHQFADLAVMAGLGGAPLLQGCCAWFECRNEIKHLGGDHLVFIGQVERFTREDKHPLVFQGGQYRALNKFEA